MSTHMYALTHVWALTFMHSHMYALTHVWALTCMHSHVCTHTCMSTSYYIAHVFTHVLRSTMTVAVVALVKWKNGHKHKMKLLLCALWMYDLCECSEDDLLSIHVCMYTVNHVCKKIGIISNNNVWRGSEFRNILPNIYIYIYIYI